MKIIIDTNTREVKFEDDKPMTNNSVAEEVVESISDSLGIVDKVVTKTTAKVSTTPVDDTRFDKIFDYLLFVEGDYSNDKADKGGKTRYGIIESEARSHGYKGDMKKLPMEFARNIYKEKYYLRYGLDKITDSRVSLSIVDWYVNSGSWGLSKAQVAANLSISGTKDTPLAVDGKIGPKSIDAINSIDPDKFLVTYHKLQRDFYDAIVRHNPSQKVFLKGWYNRVARKEQYIKTMEV